MESTLRDGAGAPGLRLIETMRVGAARLDLHAERMASGAAALGWGFDRAAFLAACAVDPMRGVRLRVTLDVAGRFDVTQAALPDSPAVWRLGLAAERLASGDAWLTIKSTRRAAYDAARAALPSGVDEMIFANERGEVCDGSITTVFFDRGQGMRTPPVTSGLLPGVLRAEMGCAQEVLRVEDLPTVRLWVGNALRGLIPAVWGG